MRKGAELTILAFAIWRKIGRTELSLIFIRMIELFYSIVCFLAIVAIRTVLVVVDVPALL